MKIRKLYEGYVAYTNDVSAETKQVFLDLDKNLEAIRSLKLKSLTIKKSEDADSKVLTFTEPLVELGAVPYYCLSSLLLSNFKRSDTIANVQLVVEYDDQEYTLSYSSLTREYTGYPTEGFSGISKSNIDDILKFHCILKSDNINIDDTLRYYILSLFNPDIRVEYTADAQIFFDIIFNKSRGVESKSLKELDAEMASLQLKIDKHSANAGTLDEKYHETEKNLQIAEITLKNAMARSSDINTLKAEAESLKQKQAQIEESFTLIKDIIPLIEDELYSYHQQGVTNDAVEVKELLAKKKYTLDMQRENENELKYIKARGDEILKLLDSSEAADVADIGLTIERLSHDKAVLASELERANAVLMEAVSYMDELRGVFHKESKRLETLKYAQEIDYNKTASIVNAPLFLRSETMLSNYIFILMKYILSDCTEPISIVEAITELKSILEV